MILLAVMLALAALMLTAAPALAKGNHNNAVNEERGEPPRQQAQEEKHFNNFGFFPSQCVGLCNFGFPEDNFVGFDNGCFDFNCGFENENVFFTPVNSCFDFNCGFEDEDDFGNCFCGENVGTASCNLHQILDLNTNQWIWVC